MHLKRFATILAFLIATSPLLAEGADSYLAAPNASASPSPRAGRLIARLWHGRTLASKADEYEKYLNATGVKQILTTPGNKGVEVLRRDEGPRTDFVVLSYWDSIASIQKFAGKDYNRAVIMGRDREFLVEIEPQVLHYEVVRAGAGK